MKQEEINNLEVKEVEVVTPKKRGRKPKAKSDELEKDAELRKEFPANVEGSSEFNEDNEKIRIDEERYNKDKFREFMQKTRNLLKDGSRFNAKGRDRFPFAMLDYLGIDTYEKLDAEMDQVVLRTTQRSSGQREAIKKAWFVCQKYTEDNAVSE